MFVPFVVPYRDFSLLIQIHDHDSSFICRHWFFKLYFPLSDGRIKSALKEIIKLRIRETTVPMDGREADDDADGSGDSFRCKRPSVCWRCASSKWHCFRSPQYSSFLICVLLHQNSCTCFFCFSFQVRVCYYIIRLLTSRPIHILLIAAMGRRITLSSHITRWLFVVQWENVMMA